MWFGSKVHSFGTSGLRFQKYCRRTEPFEDLLITFAALHTTTCAVIGFVCVCVCFCSLYTAVERLRNGAKFPLAAKTDRYVSYISGLPDVNPEMGPKAGRTR